MTLSLNYRFQPFGHHMRVEDQSALVVLGSIDMPAGQYVVRDEDDKVVAVVETVEDAVPALLDHYEKHPAPWRQDSPTVFGRSTISGDLCVAQEPLGFWSVYRNQETILLHDGRPAAFPTADEAKHIADTHAHDPLDKLSSDRFSWMSMSRQ